MKFLIALTLLFVSQAYAGPSLGKCPGSPIIADFDPTKYVGRWYEIERLSGSFETNLKCVTATYGLKNETTVSVRNRGINIEKGTESVIEGYAFVKNVQEPNRLIVRFPQSVAGLINFETSGNYDVWATDYNNYALVYSCTQIVPSVLKLEMIWVLSRQTTLDDATVQTLKGQLKTANVDVAKFEKVAQDC